MPDTIDFKKLGHEVRFLRQGKDWTLADLAERSGVSKAYISDLENGVAGKPNVQYVYSVARALDATIDRLIKGAVSPGDREPKARKDPLPPGLKELQAEMDLSPDEVEMLAGIHFRGRRPKDKDGWRYLVETLSMLGERGPRGK